MLVTNNKSLIIMGCIFTICALMTIEHFFWGVACVSLLAILLRVLSATHIIRPLKRLHLTCLSVTGLTILIYSAFYYRNIADTFISLLLMGCSLKFLEYANKRDLYVQCTALLFLTAVPLIFHYEFYIIIYIVLMIILLFWSFISITHKQSNRSDFKLIIRLFAPALPVAIVMFLVLPRTGAFWVIPNTSQAHSGISPVLTPGSIDRISKSDKLIARVMFHGPIPASRYFRAIVYEKSTPMGWVEGDTDSAQRRQLLWYKYLVNQKRQPTGNGKTTEYDVILESLNTPYIPTLRYSITNQKRVFYLNSDVYTNNNNSASRQYLHFTYLPDKAPIRERLEKQQIVDLLHYNLGSNKKTQELVHELTGELTSDKEKVQAILRYFSTNKFIYTLEPGSYKGSTMLDDFLFTKRAGFCVHYAHAMAVMLRMAGIPSRLVGGYMGGEINADENYVTLKEYDAHAWVEAFVDDAWVEYDPTALIAEWDASSGESVVARANGISEEKNIWTYLADIKESIDIHWTKMILNFDSDTQKGMFKDSLMLVLGVVIMAFIIYFLIVLFTSKAANRDIIAPELVLMRKAVALIISGNSARNPANEPEPEIWHTFGEFARMLAEHRSKYSEAFNSMYSIYFKLHYQQNIDRNTAMKELKESFTRLKKI